jgi:predicted RecA/RadA family phage recombinase
MKKWLTSAALAASIAALAAPAVAAPPSTAPSGPPTTVSFSQALSGCDFGVTATVTGKAKEITLPSGGLIVTAPNQRVTVTNDKTGQSADFLITGVFFITTDAKDNITFKVRGRNLLTRSNGIFLTAGNFTFSFDKNGNVITEFDTEGSGNVIDVCAALS